MIKSIYILLVFVIVPLCVNAQDTSIIDDLNTPKAGEGKITIYQDSAIKNLLGSIVIPNAQKPSKSINNASLMNQLNTTSDSDNTKTSSKSFVKTRGYRIQAYSGSNQKRSKNEAQSRRNSIRSSFPNMDVYVTYESPVWRVKAGNFKTREQAAQALSKMKSQFPLFGREMYIVSDVVSVPVN